jgi:uncharacterized protein Yka (UPF0111/DUF47 family)
VKEDDHNGRMRKAVEHLERAKEEINKTLSFLKEVKRVEQAIENREQKA